MVQVRIGRSRPRFSATEIENETKRHCRLGVVVLKDVPRVGGYTQILPGAPVQSEYKPGGVTWISRDVDVRPSA